MNIEPERSHQHRISAADRRGDEQHRLAGRGIGGENRVRLRLGIALALAVPKLLAQPPGEVDGVICADADGEGSHGGGGDLQWNTDRTHQPEHRDHRRQQRHQDERRQPRRAEQHSRNHKNHYQNLQYIHDLAAHHHVVHRRRRRDAAAQPDCHTRREILCDDWQDARIDVVNKGRAVGLDERLDDGVPIRVINEPVEIARLARHGIEQKILRDEIGAARQHASRRGAAVHAPIDLLEHVHKRQRVANLGLGREKRLRLLHGAQNGRVLDGIVRLAFHQHVKGVGTGHRGIENTIILTLGDACAKKAAQGIVDLHLRSTGHQRHIGQHRDREDALARLGRDNLTGEKRRHLVPEALGLFRIGLPGARWRQNGAQSRRKA